MPWGLNTPFFLIRAGVELKAATAHLWAQGELNPVDAILLGVVQDEGTEFLDHIKPTANASDYAAWINLKYVNATAAAVARQYPPTVDTTPWFSASRVFTDSLMACPARRGAAWATSKGWPAYLYRFTHVPYAVQVAAPTERVGHSRSAAAPPASPAALVPLAGILMLRGALWPWSARFHLSGTILRSSWALGSSN